MQVNTWSWTIIFNLNEISARVKVCICTYTQLDINIHTCVYTYFRRKWLAFLLRMRIWHPIISWKLVELRGRQLVGTKEKYLLLRHLEYIASLTEIFSIFAIFRKMYFSPKLTYKEVWGIFSNVANNNFLIYEWFKW